MKLREIIASVTGGEVSSAERLAGGDLGGAYLVHLADGGRLVAKHGPLVSREAAMLRAIAATGAPAPEVYHAEGELLLMEYVEADGEKGWESLAAALTMMHQRRTGLFGWESDYAFGPVAIPNARHENWPEFWAQNRLLCHGEKVDASLTRRLEKLSARLSEILPANISPALLHGDLWGGNILFHKGQLAALIDPACAIGHREVDVAMLTLFDFPPDAFFDALDLEPGWRERLPAYRLWPLLVHLRLFGHSYRKRVKAELAKLGC